MGVMDLCRFPRLPSPLDAGTKMVGSLDRFRHKWRENVAEDSRLLYYLIRENNLNMAEHWPL